MLTEDEAKTKWCPFARMLLVDEINGTRHATTPAISGFNRTGVQGCGSNSDQAESRCVGSACMAWRWSVRPGLYDKDNPENGPLERGVTYAPHEWFRKEGSGYCGLAGRP